MAKSCADLPEDDEELRKKLWLKIARHVVQEEKDVKKAMNCLSSCDLLKIEDILPFFPDFVTIDHFKVGDLSRWIKLVQSYAVMPEGTFPKSTGFTSCIQLIKCP